MPQIELQLIVRISDPRSVLLFQLYPSRIRHISSERLSRGQQKFYSGQGKTLHQGYIGLSSEQAPLYSPCEQRDPVHGRHEFWPIVLVGQIELRYREGGGFQKEAWNSGC